MTDILDPDQQSFESHSRISNSLRAFKRLVSKPFRRKAPKIPVLKRQNTGISTVSNRSRHSTYSYAGSVIDYLFLPRNQLATTAAANAAANSKRNSLKPSHLFPTASKMSNLSPMTSAATTAGLMPWGTNAQALMPVLTGATTAKTGDLDPNEVTSGQIAARNSDDYSESQQSAGDEDEEEEEEEEKVNPGYKEWKRMRREWTKGGSKVVRKESVLLDIPETMYPRIYQCLVQQARPLRQPINLEDGIRVIKAGWVADGQWAAAQAASAAAVAAAVPPPHPAPSYGIKLT